MTDSSDPLHDRRRRRRRPRPRCRATPIATTPLDAAWHASRRRHRAAQPRPLGRRARRRRARRRRHGRRHALADGRRPTSTVVGYVPAGQRRVRRDPPRPARATSARRSASSSASSRASPIRPRSTPSSTRSSTGSSPKAPRASRRTRRDIKPWFDGELAFSMGPLPADAAPTGPQGDGKARALVLLSIKDEALARAWFDERHRETGVTTHDGDLRGRRADGRSRTPAATRPGRVRDPRRQGRGRRRRRVRQGRDRHRRAASRSRSGDAFEAALAAPTGDHLGFVFVDLRADARRRTASDGAAASAPPRSSERSRQFVPEWAAFRLRVEGDALVMDGVDAARRGAPGPDDNRANGVASTCRRRRSPRAGNDYGATLDQTLELYARTRA